MIGALAFLLLQAVPYKDAPSAPTAAGSAGTSVVADRATEVRIGYFGPADPKHPLGGSFWVGATQAIADLNREGGHQGKPFRLIPAWTENPWAGGISRLAQIAYDEDVRAVVGSIDGASTHLVEQVAAKALFPIVDPGSTDRTVNLAPVPWIFSCLPSDRAIAEALGPALPPSFVIVRATDHDSRALSKELEKWLARKHITPGRVLDYTTTAPQFDEDVQAAVIFAPPAESAALVREYRRTHSALMIFGGPAMARTAFRESAGRDGDGARVPVLAVSRALHPDWDYAAVQAYDAVRMLAEAIRIAGLDRERIRDALRGMSAWQGAGGSITWDVFGRNTRTVRLATIKDGRIL